jgi:hypothetical protein
MSRYKLRGWHYERYRHSLAAKGIKTRLSFVRINENLSYKWIRINRGYKDIVQVDAKALKERFEKDNNTPLAWKQLRFDLLKNFEEFDQYPEVDVLSSGKIDFNDGRHRVAVAAARGETIEIAVKNKDKFLEAFNKQSFAMKKRFLFALLPEKAGFYMMDPDDFLSMTTSKVGVHSEESLKQDFENEGYVTGKSLIKEGVKNPASLEIKNGKVVGHEGRHRAIAAKMRGEKLPVVVGVFGDDSIYKRFEASLPVDEKYVLGGHFGQNLREGRLSDALVRSDIQNSQRLFKVLGIPEKYHQLHTGEKLGT